MSRPLTPQPPSRAEPTLASSSMPDLHSEPPPDPTTPIASGSRTKFKMPWKRDKEGIRRTKDLAELAVGVLKRAVSLAAELSGDAGVPGLSAALSAVGEILDAIQTMSETIKGVDMLKERLEGLTRILEGFRSRDRGRPPPEEMLQRLEGLAAVWKTIGAKAHEIKRHNWISRFLKSEAYAAELEGLVEEINTSISEFNFQGQLAIEENVCRIREAVESVLNASFMPVYAKKAQYDANSIRRRCLEGTRVDILRRLRQWVILACTYKDSTTGTNPGNVLWMCGLAGTGKTTIAGSISHICKELGVLAATFFCSRFDKECSDEDLIFVTISRQLCNYHAPFKEQVEAVIRRDPDVVHSNPTRQCEELIVQPLEALKGSFPKAAVILDALDECSDQGATSTTLTVLAKFIWRIKDYLVFIVTSRPEPHIAVLFDEARESSLRDTTPLLLHMEELESVSKDIRHYFVQDFKAHAEAWKVPDGWPSAEDVNTLTRMSHGLFIWAATAVLFVMQGDPPDQMRLLIDEQGVLASPDTVLDALYKQIAEAAASKIPESSQDRFQLILGTIAVAQEPLSAATLAKLLDIPSSSTVHNLLRNMRSVLHVPEDPTSEEPIRVIHPTFPEFLLASRVEKPRAFYIDAPTQHFVLFSRSLAAMGQLQYDICHIGDPLRLKAEVDTLEEDVKKYIPPHLQYVCRHWGAHLQGATRARLREIAGRFQSFLGRYFLNWLEVCSLLNVFDPAVLALDTARRVDQETGGAFAEVTALIIDGHRFLSTFVGCIDDAPLQVYHSALALAPSGSRVRKIYGSGLRDSVVVCIGEMQDWGPCLDAFRGHDGYVVYCVAFSPDGTCFATGGGDHKIAIRRSTTRTLLLSIGGHRGDVNCVAFSPDGSHIASGSDDKTVGVWRVTSGDRVHTLGGHTGPVYSVTYSQNGSRILSASRRQVVLWDMSDGSCLLTLPMSIAETWQAGLSPDGDFIAHRSDPGVRLYNITSESGTTLPLPDPAHAAVFSPDGRFIAAASETSICIWTAVEQAVVRSIDVPSFPFRLVFSSDGTRLACGLEDGSVCVWQVESEEPPHVFRGHTERVYDVAWSRDDTQIVSASGDNNVRVWDPTRRPDGDTKQQSSASRFPSPSSPPSTLLCRGDSIDIVPIPPAYNIEQLQMPPGAPTLSLHSNVPEAWDAVFSTAQGVSDMAISKCMRSRDWELLTGRRHMRANWRPMAISPDFSQMAYLPEGVNDEVHICNLNTGTAAAALTGHTDDVCSVTFSSNGALLVTGSEDNTVKVWDVASAALVASHTEHTDRVWDAAFSPDDRLVVSGSQDGTARVYDIAASRITHVLRHMTTVMKVAFSADSKLVLTLDADRDVSIWDLSQGTCIHRVSLAGNTWPRALDFAPDGSSLVIRDLAGKVQTVFPIAKPSERTWPTYSVSGGGWVTAVRPGRARRVCWLLPEWRAIFPLGDGRFCALDFDRKMSAVFDVLRTSAYARLLDDS